MILKIIWFVLDLCFYHLCSASNELQWKQVNSNKKMIFQNVDNFEAKFTQRKIQSQIEKITALQSETDLKGIPN